MQTSKTIAAIPGAGPDGRTLRDRVRARLAAVWPAGIFRRDAEGGQSMVEFALVLPVMLLVVTGITAFGLVLNNYLMLTNAVSIGARALAISRGQTTDPCATAAGVIYKAAPQLKTASYTFTVVLNGTTYNGASCSSGSTTTGAAGNLVQGSTATLTAKYPCTLKVYGANYAPTCNITAQTAELVQ